MKYYGICPASCGEFVQGIVDRDEYLCSYAIDLYSTAEVEEKLNNINIGPSKSRKAIEAVFKKFNIPIEESKNISLKIKSKIPVGKGMASSTADIGATIGATLGLIKKELSNEEIANLASTIEPTDSIYIEKNNIFNPLNGEVIKYLGNIQDSRVVILEPNRTLNTMRMRKTPNYKKIKIKNKDITKISFNLLEEGIKNNDLYSIGKASTFSSQQSCRIPHKASSMFSGRAGRSPFIILYLILPGCSPANGSAPVCICDAVNTDLSSAHMDRADLPGT